jgi:hypothetical protein
MRIALLLCLFLAACGALGSNAGQCQPACTSGQQCCSEPTHMASADGGVGNAWVCVTTSSSVCPLQP